MKAIQFLLLLGFGLWLYSGFEKESHEVHEDQTISVSPPIVPSTVLIEPKKHSTLAELNEYAKETDRLFRELKKADSKKLHEDLVEWGVFARKFTDEWGKLRKKKLSPPLAAIKVGSAGGQLLSYFSILAHDGSDIKRKREMKDYCEKLIRERDQYIRELGNGSDSN